MRVCVIVDRPPLYNGGFSQRVQREIGLISKINGIEVYIYALASIRSFYVTKNIKRRFKEIYNQECIKDIKLNLLLPSKIVKKMGKMNSYYDYYARKIGKYAKNNKIDIMLCENLDSSYIGYLIREMYNIPYVMDYHGAVPEEAEFFGECKRGDSYYNYLKYIEKMALINAKSIVVVSNAFQKYITSSFDIQKDNVFVVPCCVEHAENKFNIISRNAIRKELNVEDRKILIYAGSVTKYQCIDEMISIFHTLHSYDDAWYFVFLSAYPQLDLLKEKFKMNNVSGNDYCILSVKHDKVNDYYSCADVGIIIRHDHILNRVASPTKIPEYLSSGLYLLGTDNIGDIKDVLSDKTLLSYEEILDPNNLSPVAYREYETGCRQKNALKAQAFLQKNYIWDNYIDEYSKMLS